MEKRRSSATTLVLNCILYEQPIIFKNCYAISHALVYSTTNVRSRTHIFLLWGYSIPVRLEEQHSRRQPPRSSLKQAKVFWSTNTNLTFTSVQLVSTSNTHLIYSVLPSDYLICSSGYTSEILEEIYVTIGRGRFGPGSSLCSTPPRSRVRTSPWSPCMRRLPPGPAEVTRLETAPLTPFFLVGTAIMQNPRANKPENNLENRSSEFFSNANDTPSPITARY